MVFNSPLADRVGAWFAIASRLTGVASFALANQLKDVQ